MAVIEYRRRASIAQKSEVLWRAYPDRLEQVGPDGGAQAIVPFRNVRKVRVAFAPGRLQTQRFLMELTGASSRLVLTNMHFQGIGQFENRSDSFFPLVRHVVNGVRTANPTAEFRAGEQPALYWLLLGFTLAVFGLLLLIILSLPLAPGNLTVSIAIKSGIILFSLPLLMSWAIKARPRRLRLDGDLDRMLASHEE
jgi:hypothetical protein